MPRLSHIALAVLFAITLRPDIASAQSGRDVFNAILGVGAQVLQNEIEQKQQKSQPQPAPKVSKKLPDATLAETQRLLNLLGYDAGPEDGLMGARTRNAIVAYQADIGAATNGMLSDVQLESLRQSALKDNQVAAASASLSTFNMLPNTDLPGGDIRSGMDDPALRDISVEDCQQLCAANAQCGAFTYNEKHQVCFLKAGQLSAEGFSGAISGIKLAEASSSVPGTQGAEAPGEAAATDWVLYSSGWHTAVKDRSLELRLGKLLMLRADPGLFDEAPEYYADLLPRSAYAPYLDDATFTGIPSWEGRDEFERADSRKRFIAEKGPVIMALVPQGDIKVRFLQLLDVRSYENGGFSISGAWSDGGIDGRLNIPAPLKYPGVWEMSENEARSFRQVQHEYDDRLSKKLGYEVSPGEGLRLALITDYVIRGASRTADGVVVDTAVTALTIVDRDDLTSTFATLPLPANSITTQVADGRDAGTGPVEFDPELFRLYAARLEPKLLDDRAFLANGFAVRRTIEELLVHDRGDKRLRTSWPSFYSAGMLAMDDPTTDALSTYRFSIESRLGALGDTFVIGGIDCPHLARTDGYAGTCAVRETDNGPVFKLDPSFMMNVTIPWDYAKSRVHVADTNAIRLSSDSRPPLRVFGMPSGADLAVYAVIPPDTAWSEMELTDVPMDTVSMGLELAISEIELRQNPLHLVVGLKPVKAVLQSPDGATFDVALAKPEGEQGNVETAFAPDVLGITLGMSRAEAEAVLTDREGKLEGATRYAATPEDGLAIRKFVHANAPGSAIEIKPVYDSPNRYRLSEQAVNRLLDDGSLLLQYGPLKDENSALSPYLADQLAVFYGEDDTARLVYRYQGFSEPIDVASIVDQVTSKYGKPDFDGKFMVWAQDPARADMLRVTGDVHEACGIWLRSENDASAFIPWRDRSGFGISMQNAMIFQPALRDLGTPCGGVLMVRVMETSVELYLFDTTYVTEKMARIAAGDAEAEEESASATTKAVQF